MDTTRTHIAHIERLAGELGWPDARFNDVACDAAAIREMDGRAFLWAIAPWGTQVYWFGLEPNPWKSLEKFLNSTWESLPQVRYYLIGPSQAPIEVPVGSSERDVRAHFYCPPSSSSRGLTR